MLRIIQLFWTVLSLLVSLLGGQKVVPYHPDDYAAELPQYVVEGEVRVELLRDTLVRLEVLKRAAAETDEEIVAETDEAVRRTEEDNE